MIYILVKAQHTAHNCINKSTQYHKNNLIFLLRTLVIYKNIDRARIPDGYTDITLVTTLLLRKVTCHTLAALVRCTSLRATQLTRVIFTSEADSRKWIHV